jgi:hypothetical protein
MRRLWIPFVSALTACAAGEDTSTAPGFSGASASASASATMTPTTGMDPTEDPTGSPVTTTATEAATSLPDPATSDPSTTSTADDTTGFETNPDGAANGLECTADLECQTGHCYKIPLPLDDLPPGICSECNTDQDCVDRGLGISCTVDPATLGGHCTDGGLGSFCATQAACKPQYYCDEILNNADGLLPHACGECRDDQDCKDGKRCTPRIDLDQYTGNKYCAAPGSVPNDGLCPEFTGNGVCANGHCGVVNVVGTVNVGICGQCSADADCAAPKVCMPGTFSDGIFGATCV